MENVTRDYLIGEFRGEFPDVPIDPRVDLAALTQGDDDPFFVTLPVTELGRKSDNGLLHDDALVNEVEQNIVGRGGIMGHLSADQRGTAFPIENVDWVGKLRVGNTVYGKAYVPPSETREYIRRLKARGGQLATSIYGPHKRVTPLRDGGHRVEGFHLEQVDLAPADRAALKFGGAFAITAQMDNNQMEDDMPDKEQILAELTDTELRTLLDRRPTIREAMIAEWQNASNEQARVEELENDLAAEKTITAELRGQLAEIESDRFDATVDNQVAEMFKGWKVSEDNKPKLEALQRSLRARVVAEMGDKREDSVIAETVKSVWDEEFKLIAETLRDALAGPAATIAARMRATGQRTEIDTSAEAGAKARSVIGI